MMRKPIFRSHKRARPISAAAALCLATVWAQAQAPTPAAPTTTAPAAAVAPAAAASGADPGEPGAPRREFKLPELRDIGLAVPRPVLAASALLGMGRQRLALVVGIGTVGARPVVDSAGRDAQAVGAALRRAGFVVMLREDLGAADLRAALQEFHARLQAGGIGFAYVTGLGAQVEGQNLLLPRDSQLDPTLPLAERQAQWRQVGVPLSEVVDALMGPADAPRLLVVDAAYQNPALAGLPAAGLSALKLPPGMMALYGHPLGKTQEVPAVAALPSPAPTDARELAASPFARVLVGQLLTLRRRAPEVLRATHRSLYDSSVGQNDIWIAGDTDNEELAEASLLDVIPRTPEEIAREAASQAARALSRQTAAGTAAGATSAAGAVGGNATAAAAAGAEQSVADVLQQLAKTPPDADAAPGDSLRPRSARQAMADGSGPGAPNPPGSLASTAANVGGAVSTAAGVLGTAANVASTAVGLATTAATAAAIAKATEAAVAVSVGSTALSAAGTVAGQMLALAARSASSTAAEPQAAAVTQRLAAARAAQATPAAAATAEVAAPIAPAAPAVPVARAGQALPAAPSGPTAARASAAPGELPVELFGGTPVTPSAAANTAAREVARTAQATPAGPAAPDGRTVRNPEGGERPVFAPRTNSYGYAEGDTYTYQVLDTWKGEVAGRYTTAIEEVLPDGQMLANGQQMLMDAQGRLKKLANADGSISKFEPSQDLWWSNPKLGESRDLRFTETIERAGGRSSEVDWKGSTSVGKPRKIETPAGEFEVLPIESSGWAYEVMADGLRSTKWSRTVWYSPKLGHPVAIDIQDADRLGKLLKRERVELLHAQASRAATP